ncbi:MAG TPA: hypothetical protein VFQ07_01795 [Candidatus Polarisedimenticolia bacterium]|nr:hypothetical protein [Candidatus Polarisedimenticolia bacterium]
MRSGPHRSPLLLPGARRSPVFLPGVLAATLATALLAAPVAGGAGGAAAADGAATTGCDRFTLEKLVLGATRPEVEALGLGKVETRGQTSEEVHLRVKHTKHMQQIDIVLHHDRVAWISTTQNANAATFASLLADLRGRWGEPDKGETTFGKGVGSYKLYNWSDRSCPAYGALFWNSGDALVLLSTSAQVTHPRDPAKDFPALAR